MTLSAPNVSLAYSTPTDTEQVHSDPDDGRSLAELDRGVARATDCRTYGGTMADLGMLITAPAQFGHDTKTFNAEYFRKEKAHRAKQRDAAKRLHRRK